MELFCKDSQKHMIEDLHLQKNESKTLWVVVITSTMMVTEIVAGYFSGSMALFADGWHMASHATALVIALAAYRLARLPSMNRKFSFGAGKLIPLGGFTSAVVLAMIAVLMVKESVERLLSPQPISYNEAIGVAGIGLIVNIVSALILQDSHSHDHDHGHGHHHHEHHVHDLNLRSAFIHVCADAFTSVLAIGALVTAKLYHLNRLDPAMGIVGSGVILSWAYSLCRQTGWELLDGHSKAIDSRKLRALIEQPGVEIVDFHAWRVAPKAIACELVVAASTPKGTRFYREILRKEFNVQHLIVEEMISDEESLQAQ